MSKTKNAIDKGTKELIRKIDGADIKERNVREEELERELARQKREI